MSYRITGLAPDPFDAFWAADSAALASVGVHRVQVDACPGYPDRITLDDAPLGAEVLLLNHTSLETASPFRATHAIYVSRAASAPFDAVDRLPPAMLRRPQSLRGFDADGMMRAADLAKGQEIASVIERFFLAPEIVEIHAHNAKQGCFLARITRA